MLPNHLCKYGSGHYVEHFFEILNMEQWFKRKCRSKTFLSRAQVAILFSGAEPFVPDAGRRPITIAHLELKDEHAEK